MRRVKKILPWLPLVALAGFLFGSTATAASHESALDGLVATFDAMLSAFSLYLGAL